MKNVGKIRSKFEHCWSQIVPLVHSRGDIMMISKHYKGTAFFCMFYYEKQASGGDWDLGILTLL